MMNEEFKSYEQVTDDDLLQYGVKRRSGRYPWGSGENPYQHSGDFLSRINQMKKDGMSETEIARNILPGDDELSTTELRVLKSIANEERRSDLVATAKGLREKGYSLNEIAKKMGYVNDSSVRSLLNEDSAKRMEQSKVTADYLKEIVDKKGIVDVGKGTEYECGNISRTKMEEAIYRLELEGYERRGVGIPQNTNPGKQTITYVLCKPGTEKGAEYNYENIHSIKEYDKKLVNDGNDIRSRFEYPSSMDSDRLQVRYAEDGGERKDGIVEIRRNVPDLDLGKSNYAQVRIMVDGTHYIKGMAVYGDDKDFPPGVDVIFNSNKSKGTPVLGDKSNTVLKPIKKDPDNPFGSLIKEDGGQSYYDDPNGKYTNSETGKKQSLSLINKRAEEGDWGEWADKLPSQFLGKQNKELIDKQLALTKADKYSEFEEICSLTNPTVKKNLLKSFADDCDAAAVHLKAAALPRQKYQVIIGLKDIKDDEVYAPNYKDGEKVALIRFPHEGTFAIPILTVNNKNPEGDKYITKGARDAIGINKNVADRLSGADFDGDTVMVIPTNNKIRISSRNQLEGLVGFDSKLAYGPSDIRTDKNGDAHYLNADGKEYRTMKDTQKQMGVVSNLITDMTIRGANDQELARAVRHSMVVIDAEKHHLDYKKSEKDNGIAELKQRYQGHIGEDGNYHEGAGTLMSRAKGEKDVDKRQGSPYINYAVHPRTGKVNERYDPTRPEGALLYKTAKDIEYTDKNGKVKRRQQKSTRMAETDDARTLISDVRHPKEEAYAEYANEMKALGNKARMEYLKTESLKYNPSAAKAYAPEVEQLKAGLRLSEMNAPRERRAQALANSRSKAKIESDPSLKKDEIKKIKNRELLKARAEVGAQRSTIDITDRQWQAIQAGAISETQLTKILNHAKPERVRELATPRTKNEMTPAKISRAKALRASGYTNQQIAEALGCSSSTIGKYLAKEG